MKFSLSAFAHLPLPLKVASSVLGGGSLMGLVYLLFPGHFWVIFVGLVVVAVFLGLYAYILKLQKKRRAAPMEQGLMSNSAATPHGISAAASVARLDDLNRKFEEGLEKFRSAGKNIYSLPWYALVGEPGSGKTEAIRHCNVGFPPGLQDQLQGSGGTLNMNWWFTNHAVILDTAGRLMFEEVQPGTTGEWEEFMKLLRSNRPNCPINGMLLTISAESLIKDTADNLEHKGGKIAQQLDNIQRVLGVRFPVFIMITKCDLINGFREFFDDLTDPQLQHQVLGWSNPAQLDEPFSPADVEKHLEIVKQRLLRRRMRLLLDPVNTEDAEARRTEQVDSLYAFPEALMKLAPRLRRYLEMIFVAGEWSAKPLFLRGIYFTSAMREGSALDADLAEVLGVPVDSLPEGRVWEQDRAYFLRDLFLKKVFFEKGLVTRASNTRQLQRQRKGAVLGCGLGGLALFFLLTGFGASQLKKSVGGQLETWQAIEKRFVSPSGSPRIVDQAFPGSPYEYNGETRMNLADVSTTFGQLPFEMRLIVEKKISTPLVFQPLRLVRSFTTEGFDTSRRKAMRAIFETSFLQPLFETAVSKMQAAKGEGWSSIATGALAQMIRMQIVTHSEQTLLGGGLSGDSPDELVLDDLFRYVLESANGGGEYQKYKADDESLQATMGWIYAGKGGDQDWPPRIPALSGEAAVQAIASGVDAFAESWSGQVVGSGDNLLAQLVGLMDALEQFRKGETVVRQIGDDLSSEISVLGVDVLAQEWRKAIDLMVEAKQKIDAARISLGDRIDEPIDDLCKTARDQVLSEGALPLYERLEQAMSEEGRKNLDDTVRSGLARVRSKLKGERETLERLARKQASDLEEELPKLARLLLTKAPRGEARLYEISFDMYQHADSLYQKGVGAVDDLIQKYKAFPLCRTRDLRQELSVERAAAAFELLSRMKGGSDESAGLATAAIRQGGGMAFYKQVKEKLDRMIMTSRSLVVGNHQEWYERLDKIGQALAGDTPLSCQIIVLPFTEQRERPQIPGVNLSDVPLTPYRYFDVTVGDVSTGPRFQTDRVPKGDPIEVVIPGKKLSFRFFDHLESEQPGGVADADAPWTMIKSLHQLDARPDDKDPQVWKVALIMKDVQGNQFYYWIGLKFNRPIPDLDTWPTEDQWPKVH
jgi:hypothetical protein